MQIIWRIVRSLLAVLLIAGPGAAGQPVEFVTPSEIVKPFDLGPGIVFDVVLSFEDATNLAVDSLSISARLIDINAMPCDECDRMPQNVFIPGRFPVLVTIVPDQPGFTFRGKWSLELVTDNLEFTSNSPLRLFHAATSPENFEDITLSVGLGSYRVRGFSGSFSEFVIAADLRPGDPVIVGKFARVNAILTAASPPVIASPVHADLVMRLGDAQTAYGQDEPDAASALVTEMIGIVTQNSGNGVPDGWDPNDGTAVSIAGRLRGALHTLRFSLALVERTDTPEAGSVRRTFDLGGGTITGTAILRFDEAFDIDLKNAGLGFSAQLINPDDFLIRLPAGVFVPSEFPVLFTINPADGQSFSSSFSLELITENLRFVGDTPLRLFKAPDGGIFTDITETYGVGSYRVRGFSGSFSEFLIVSDSRPLDDVLTTKFDRLEAFLDTHLNDVPAGVRILFDRARSEFDAAAYALAIETLEDFVDAVDANRDTIPAVWLPNDSVVNVVGSSRALAKSLRFNLVQKNTPITVGDLFRYINLVYGDGVAPERGEVPVAAPEAMNQPVPKP